MSALIDDLRRAAADRDRHTRDSAERAGRAEVLGADDPLVVYFSSISGNTHKFVQKLRARSVRLPLAVGADKTAEAIDRIPDIMG